MDGFKANSWGEKDEWDDIEFLAIEKEIYLKTFLPMADLVAEDNECKDEDGKCVGGVIKINDDSGSSGRDDSDSESSGSGSEESC